MENPSPEQSNNENPTKYPEEFAGEPWDEFEFGLDVIRHGIGGVCSSRRHSKEPTVKAYFLGNNTYPDEWVDEAWIEETCARLAKLSRNNWWENEEVRFWWNQAQTAWEYLGTAQNRLRALQLLYDAGREFADQIYLGSQFWQATKTERQAQQRKLQKARRKAVRTINAAGQAFSDYFKTVVALESFSDRPVMVNAGTGDFLPEPSYEASRELEQRLKEIQEFADHFSRTPVPNLLAKEQGQRGRRKKTALNNALFALVEIFQNSSSHLSRNKALEYTHCLLYLSGVWPDEDPHGLAAKHAQLRKSHSQLPS